MSLSKADVILSLDADFLYAGFPGFTRYARDFAKRRNPDAGEMSRLYVVESTPSSTGARADHRLPLRASEIENVCASLCYMRSATTPARTHRWRRNEQKFLRAVAKDLKSHRGSSVVIAGDHQPPVVHAFAHAMNQSLGNVGKTVFYTDPVNANPVNQTESLKDLVADMRGGQGGHADHHGRQSRLRCARRLGLRRRAQESEASRSACISAFTRTRPRNSASGT